MEEEERRREEEGRRGGGRGSNNSSSDSSARPIQKPGKSTLNPTVHAGKNGPDLSINIDTCITLGLCWPVVRMALVETVIARP